jgi:hypothetical protein
VTLLAMLSAVVRGAAPLVPASNEPAKYRQLLAVMLTGGTPRASAKAVGRPPPVTLDDMARMRAASAALGKHCRPD